MKSQEEGGMVKLAASESIGGNAGRNRLGVNFHFDQNSGELVYFENIQNVPSEIKEKYSEGIFRMVAVEDENFFADELIATFCNYKLPETSREILHESVSQYNELVRGSGKPNKKLSYPVPALFEDKQYSGAQGK